MSFKEAIIQAVNEQGREIIGQKKFYALLADYGAFKDEREIVKRIVKEINDNETFHEVVAGKTKPGKAINRIIDDVSEDNGFDKDEVQRVTVTLFSGLGLLTPKEENRFLVIEVSNLSPNPTEQDILDNNQSKNKKPESEQKATTEQVPKTKRNNSRAHKIWPYLTLAAVIICGGLFWLIRSDDGNTKYRSDKPVFKTEKIKIDADAGRETIVLKEWIPNDSCKVSSSCNWCCGKLTTTGDLEVSWFENDSKKERDGIVTLNSPTLNVKCLIHQKEKVGFFGRLFRFLGKAILWIIGIGAVLVWGIAKLFN